MSTASVTIRMVRVVCYLPELIVQAIDRESLRKGGGISRSEIMRHRLAPMLEEFERKGRV